MELLVEFLIFIILQALCINGIHYCFHGGCVNDIVKGKVCSGNVFYKISPSFYEKHRGKWWTFPLWNCVRCMASVYGSLTFWPTVIYLFGFHYVEIPVWIFDMFILVTVNWIIYKKL